MPDFKTQFTIDGRVFGQFEGDSRPPLEMDLIASRFNGGCLAEVNQSFYSASECLEALERLRPIWKHVIFVVRYSQRLGSPVLTVSDVNATRNQLSPEEWRREFAAEWDFDTMPSRSAQRS